MERHKAYKVNHEGRDFVVGDIHGCFELLNDQLAYLGFDPSKDRLFSVGDLIDRGPDSEKCLGLLDEPWFHMVRGNHEEMLINACGYGGESYNWWESYGAWAKWIEPDIMKQWADKIAAMPLAITIDLEHAQIGICHAEPDGQVWSSMIENPKSESVMLWGRRVLRQRPDYDVDGVDITIHGHTPLDKPIWVGNRYFMDTGACETGNLVVRKVSDIHQEYSDVRSVFGTS